jgi:hypothetical protein
MAPRRVRRRGFDGRSDRRDRRLRRARAAARLAQLEAIEYERHNLPPSPRPRAIERALRDTLDGFVELGIAIEPLVPEAVFSWYRNN